MGVRAKFHSLLGNTRIAMQIDIGFSDVITPGSVEIAYPVILDQPPAHLYAYNRETVVAEKLEAMVKLGELNSRMKDFFDIGLLAGSFDFDGRTLGEAVRRTFWRRGTQLTAEPMCFADSFSKMITQNAHRVLADSGAAQRSGPGSIVVAKRKPTRDEQREHR